MNNRTAQIVNFYFEHDGMSNLAAAMHGIDMEREVGSPLVIDMFAASFSMRNMLPMYVYDTSHVNALRMARSLLRMPNKKGYVALYLKNARRYRAQAASAAVESARTRVWHNPQHMPSWWKVHRGDIVFWHNFTYPYLIDSDYADLMAKEIERLHIYNDLHLQWMAHSKFSIQSLRNYGVDPEDYSIIPAPHGYNLGYMPHVADRPRLLAVSRYGNGKRHAQLARTASESGLMLTVVGDGDSTAEYKRNYREAKLYESDNVRILPKLKDSGLFEAQFAGANILISASQHEGFGVPIVEGYAHSLPCLVQRGTASEELVVEGKTGYLFDSLDEVPELAERVLRDYESMSAEAWKQSRFYTMGRFREEYLRTLKLMDEARVRHGPERSLA